jgi:hypothetical protein
LIQHGETSKKIKTFCHKIQQAVSCFVLSVSG